MGVLKRRTRLISFRLSDEEYQALVEITTSRNARSISDFSRTALCQALKGTLNPSNMEPDRLFPSYVRDLIKSMQELGNVITKLSGQIERESVDIMRRLT